MVFLCMCVPFSCIPNKVSVKASPENRLPAGSFEPAGLLILFICGEIHPFAQRCFAFSVAFVQIQIAV